MLHVTQDLKVDNDGDLVLDDTGDLALDTPADTCRRAVEFRVRSELGDFEPDPYIAAGLDKFVGRPNDQSTLDGIKEAVYISLTRDGLFEKSEVFVEAVPYSASGILIMVFLQGYIENPDPVANPYDYFLIRFQFGLDTGLVTRITGVEE